MWFFSCNEVRKKHGHWDEEERSGENESCSCQTRLRGNDSTAAKIYRRKREERNQNAMP